MTDMKHASRRWTVLVALAIFALSGTAGAVSAHDVPMGTLPIQAFDCESDPGTLHPAAGHPPGYLEEHGCVPAESLAVTLHSADYDWHARCDTDAKGTCEIGGPAGSSLVLTGAVHQSTVTPGYATVEPIFETTIYTEFASEVIINLPVTGEGAAERQVLSVNVANCAEGADPDAESCERVPTAETLVKVAETTDGPLTDVPWLAPNAEGFVGFDIGPLETDTLTMLVDHEGDARFACTDLDSGERIRTIDGDPGAGDSFVIELTPISDGDIRCDVTLLDTIATPISQAH